MATSLNKIVFQTPVVNAFNADGTVNVKQIYENGNKKSDKNIIVNLSELEKNLVVNLKNYVSYKLQRDTIETSIPEDKMKILSEYKRKINFYLQNNTLLDFEELDVRSIVGGVPLVFKKSTFFTTLGFILYKKSQNFSQTIFIQNDNVSGVNAFYYDNQFLENTFECIGATINLYMDKGAAEVVIKKDSNTTIETPSFIPRIPSVSVYSYQNVNNKLLLSLSKNIGDEITKANSLDLFTDEQKNFFKTTIEQKGATYTSDLIYSVGTGNEKYFIVYRVDKKPETYSEIVIENNIIKKLDIEKLETSAIDNIIPNKKYYYCFRTQDIDGTYSDVSLIYEVQIVDQSGTIYMNQNIFKPEKKIEFIKQLNFEDRVRIYPTRAQIKTPDIISVVGKYFIDSIFAINSYESEVFQKVYQNNAFGQNVQQFLQDKSVDFGSMKNIFTNLVVNANVGVEYKFVDDGTNFSHTWETKPLGIDFINSRNNSIDNEIKKLQNDLKQLQSQEQDTFEEQVSISEQIQNLQALQIFISKLKFLPVPVQIIFDKDSIFENNRIFKARIQSQNSKKKFDVNINYTIEIINGIKLLKDTTITKNFDILKTEGLT